jgi:HPt (histidine-containing phosphotransfer) domain-containing protein
MLVNRKLAIDELGISEDDYTEFLGDLLNYAKEVIPQMQPLITESSPNEDMQHLAHSLKGACRNMRFIAAGDIAYELEQWGAGGHKIDTAAVYAELKSVLSRSFAEMKISIAFD